MRRRRARARLDELRAQMECLVKAEGADRVLLGTNFAGRDQEDEIVHHVRALPVNDADKSAVLAGNARRIFRIDTH